MATSLTPQEDVGSASLLRSSAERSDEIRTRSLNPESLGPELSVPRLERMDCERTASSAGSDAGLIALMGFGWMNGWNWKRRVELQMNQD